MLRIVVILGCKKASLNQIDFCKMLELDQSYVPNEETTMEEAMLNSQKREKIFKDNFKQLIEYSKQNGFPQIGSLKTTDLDSCKNWAIALTFFHVGQSQPKLFFEKKQPNCLKERLKMVDCQKYHCQHRLEKDLEIMNFASITRMKCTLL